MFFICLTELYCALQAHRPTSVTHAIAASFTSGTARNLVIARSTRLEINLLTPEGLQASLFANLFVHIRCSPNSLLSWVRRGAVRLHRSSQAANRAF